MEAPLVSPKPTHAGTGAVAVINARRPDRGSMPRPSGCASPPTVTGGVAWRRFHLPFSHDQPCAGLDDAPQGALTFSGQRMAGLNPDETTSTTRPVAGSVAIQVL